MSPYQYTKLPGWSDFYESYKKAGALFPTLARMGVGRMVYSSDFTYLPTEERDQQRVFWTAASYFVSMHDEFTKLTLTLEQAQELKSLGQKPLFVISAGKDNPQTPNDKQSLKLHMVILFQLKNML